MNDNSPLICVIDDESAIRESVSFLLHSAGLKVRAFSSAQEFLTNPPVEALGCLVVDVQLPGISGLDLQEELVRRDARNSDYFRHWSRRHSNECARYESGRHRISDQAFQP